MTPLASPLAPAPAAPGAMPPRRPPLSVAPEDGSPAGVRPHPEAERTAPGDADGFDARLEAALEALSARIGPLFARPEPRAQAVRYVRALLGGVGAGNSWRLAHRVGDGSPWRMQRLLTRARWEVDAFQDAVRGQVLEHLGHPDGVLTLGQVDTVKRGDKSVAVARQYAIAARRVENCQTTLLACYTSPLGTAVLDRELYLPPAWTEDALRCHQAGVPADRTVHRPRTELAQRLVERARAARTPFAWVSGDLTRGQDPELRDWLERRAVGYVLPVSTGHPVRAVGGVALPAGVLARGAAGHGVPDAVAPSWEWSAVPLGATGSGGRGGFVRLLLTRRHPGSGRTGHYLAYAPRHTALPVLAAVARGGRDTLRAAPRACESVQFTRTEVLTWTAWYRHTALALAALGVYAVAGAAHGKVPQ
ncbi:MULTISPECIES: transposase [Streptomyces]|uniref:IS701 family transposase n=1 Tax=Streptomyces ramulosus TaxID=47762 RepID=A0ABW1FE96_9ACTN